MTYDRDIAMRLSAASRPQEALLVDEGVDGAKYFASYRVRRVLDAAAMTTSHAVTATR